MPAVVQAGKHVVTADAVVVATNVPINDRVTIHTKQAPYMTYVIARGAARRAAAGAVVGHRSVSLHPPAGRPADRGQEDKTGQAPTRRAHGRLEAWARRRFPMMGPVEFAWAGQVMETQDYLAFIGRNPMDHENIYVVTGDSGMGITHGTIAGMLLGDLILGRTNPRALRSFARPARRGRDFARENSNVALQYTDWLTGATSPLPTRSRRERRHRAPRVGEDRGVPRPAGQAARAPRRLPAPRLRGALEPRGDHLGLPLPRLALRPLW